jgi:carbon storage regulator CsrA
MLVLTRLPNEAILIGDDIEITVLAISGGSVRLRISCPRMDPPVREETLRLDNLLSISGKVEVRVVSIRQEGGRVRLGVKAPRSIPIAREEAKEQFLKNQVSP